MAEIAAYHLHSNFARSAATEALVDSNSLGVDVVPPPFVLVGMLTTPSPDNTPVLARREKVFNGRVMGACSAAGASNICADCFIKVDVDCPNKENSDSF
mmetsp:Transcript_16932/g.32138  ORF Transcript_16932/g.32138 Transcript_16932/m.32138 type:complete len:99 (-) Transcript_16932:719-1015(-)